MPFSKHERDHSSSEFLTLSSASASASSSCSCSCSGLVKNQHFGLVDLFGRNRWVNPPRNAASGSRGNTKSSGNTNGQTEHASNDERYSSRSTGIGIGIETNKHKEPNNFFTLRIEHRQGGTLAKHEGEERFLLFRSDQAGAIAKVVFSSSPGTIEIFVLADAKIHVLFVKDIYRGFNLGGFLFVLCTTYLRERYSYCNILQPRFLNLPISHRISSVRCSLDAEEDVRRHDKLVQFYEHLGLRRRKRANISFINNNDGETYRRIPMKIDLLVTSFEKETPQSKYDQFAAAYSSFLPASLHSSSGESVQLDDERIGSWLVMECRNGNIQLHTTDGRALCMDELGKCKLVSVRGIESTPGSDNIHERFQLLRVSDMLDKFLQTRQQHKYHHYLTKEKELWMICCSVHGIYVYMGLTCENNLIFTEQTSFWQADENFCLTHTYDSPPRRQHHRRMWKKQSVEYVTRMHQRYSAFDLHCMTIDEALNLTKYLQANPFSIDTRRGLEKDIGRAKLSSSPSFRTYLFHTAELARKEGHPDWVQFVALVHGLASALTCIDSGSGLAFLTGNLVNDDDDDDDDFDWTIYVDTRVMGCKASKHSTFAEFRHLNPDEGNTRYNTRTGSYPEHVGLEHVLLSWTGSDYMYYMLKHNDVRLPKEAYAILKLFPLVDWHSRGQHTALSSDDDEELKLFIADFHDICQRSHNMILCNDGFEEMSDEECTNLLTNHYGLIAHKYGAGGILRW
eukprot:jgi/Psemu1/191914/e_gw1.121.138.1